MIEKELPIGYSPSMIATYINAVAILIGSLLGILIGSRLKEQFREVVFISSGLVTLVIGVQMAMENESLLVLIFSIAIGGLIGYSLGIEEAILNLGSWLEKKTQRNNGDMGQSGGGSRFAKGFLNSSVLFCSGAMSVVGSIAAGTQGDYNLIFIKSVMDGAMAIIFAAAYGAGVFASAVVVLVYQGFFTLAGSWIAPWLGTAGLADLSAAGGILLMMIGFSLIKVKEFKTGNFLPALLLAPFLSKLALWIGTLF